MLTIASHDDITWLWKVKLVTWGSTVGYPSDCLASCSVASVVCLFLICLLGYQGMALYSLILLLCPIPFRFPFSSPPFLFHSLPSFPLETGPLNPAAVTGTQMNDAGTHHVTAAADGDDDGICATCRLTELPARVCCGSTGSSVRSEVHGRIRCVLD